MLWLAEEFAYTDKNIQCKCRPPCQSTHYDVKTSLAYVPNQYVVKEIPRKENVTLEFSRYLAFRKCIPVLTLK